MVHFNLSRFLRKLRSKKRLLEKKPRQTKTKDVLPPKSQIHCGENEKGMGLHPVDSDDRCFSAKTTMSASDSGRISSHEKQSQNFPRIEVHVIQPTLSPADTDTENPSPRDETSEDVSYPIPPSIIQPTNSNCTDSAFTPKRTFPRTNRSNRGLPPIATTGATPSSGAFPPTSFSPWASPVPSTCSFESSSLVSEMDEPSDFLLACDSRDFQ